MRLIDADALRKAVNDFFDNSFEGIVSSDLIKYAEAVDDFIDNAPTIEPFEKIGAICNENCGAYMRGDEK